MNTTPRLALVSLAVGIAMAVSPSAAAASSEETDGGVVDTVTISAPIEDAEPISAPIEDVEPISAPIEDVEPISTPVGDDGVPAEAIAGGMAIAGAAIAGAVGLRRRRARSLAA